MNKAYSGVSNPVHEFLGAGAVYFNWGLTGEIKIGVTKGGSEFNDNAEFREREADGDYAPVKNHRDLTKLMPQLSIKSLRLSTSNIIKFYAGMKQDNSVAGETKIYRTIDLSSSYIDNVAFVGANRQGKLMVVVLKNVLGDGAFNLPATGKDEEIVLDVQFTAHIDDTFDPDDETTYPYYIVKDTSQVTFTVDDGVDPVEGAEIVFDNQYLMTEADGTAVFTADKGTGLKYTVTKTGFQPASGSLDVNDDVEAVPVTLTTS